ncbi:type III secretion system chaperone [Chlamydiales bacterium]|nr:type III secretion system chaperone [Chlamydiales bacterium]
MVTELDLPKSISKDRGGKYTIPLDEETVIELMDTPPGFSLYSLVVENPQKELETFYQYVLQANLFGEGTSGAILGLTEEGNHLTLTQDIDYAPTYNEFEEIVEEFFNSVEFWREETLLHKRGKLFP